MNRHIELRSKTSSGETKKYFLPWAKKVIAPGMATPFPVRRVILHRPKIVSVSDKNDFKSKEKIKSVVESIRGEGREKTLNQTPNLDETSNNDDETLDKSMDTPLNVPEHKEEFQNLTSVTPEIDSEDEIDEYLNGQIVCAREINGKIYQERPKIKKVGKNGSEKQKSTQYYKKKFDQLFQK